MFKANDLIPTTDPKVPFMQKPLADFQGWIYPEHSRKFWDDALGFPDFYKGRPSTVTGISLELVSECWPILRQLQRLVDHQAEVNSYIESSLWAMRVVSLPGCLEEDDRCLYAQYLVEDVGESEVQKQGKLT